MNPYLRFKRVASFDEETHLIQPGLLTPPIVCAAVAERGTDGAIHGRLMYRESFLAWLREALLDEELLLTNANIAYDFGCAVVAAPDLLPLVFRAYAQGRIVDCLIAEALNAIAKGHLFKERNGLPLLNSRGTQADRYSLDIVVRHNLGRADAKVNDFWKLRYAILESLPHEEWPEEARQYPVDDACNALEICVKQLGLGTSPASQDGGESHENLADLAAQCETDWALHLGAIWGLRSDESRVDLLEARARELHDEYVARFTAHGFFRKPRERYVASGKDDPEAGKKDSCAVARAVAQAYGATGTCGACRGTGHRPTPCRGAKLRGRFQKCLGPGVEGVVACATCGGLGMLFPTTGTICKECCGSGFADTSMVPKTDKDGLSTSRDTLAESGDDDLVEFAENRFEKALKTYVPYLRRGLSRPLTLEPNVIVESGRTSYRGIIQLYPRGDMGMSTKELWVPTLRECHVARPGRVFGSSDYPAGELCGFSQVALWTVGYSRMAEIINATRDPGAIHTEFGARMIGVSPEELKKRIKAGDKVAKGFRQAAKPWDFGALGGMGSCKLVLTNRKEGAGMTETADGHRYPGLRFCVLVGGMPRCGTRKLRVWGRKGYEREIPPTCQDCLEIAEHQIKPLFFDTFPEVRDYHRWVKRVMEDNDDTLPSFGPWYAEDGEPHRVRRVDTFTSGANCVDFETEALTKRGWVRGPDLRLDDELLTKNAETRALEWQHPTAINLYPEYDGPLVEFKLTTLSAVTTPDHRWLVLNRRTGRDVCMTSATICRNGFHTIHRTGEWLAQDGDYTDDFLELAGWFLTDGGAEKEPGYTSIKIYQTKKHNVVRIDALFARLDIGVKRYVRSEVGAIVWSFTNAPRRPQDGRGRLNKRRLGGGCAHSREEYKRAGVGVDFDEIVAQRLNLTTVAVRMHRQRYNIPVPVGQFPDGKGYAVRLRALFPKRVLTHEFVNTLSARQARHLVEVMMLGDGTRRPGPSFGAVFNTRSADSVSAFQALLVLAGMSSRSQWVDLSMYRPVSPKLKNVPKATGIWRVSLYNRTHSQIVRSQVREFSDKRGVWCPTVPNSYFVARRNGTVYITGNSGFQSYIADITKTALRKVVRESYMDESSPLYQAQTRTISMQHDELFCEMNEETAHLAGPRVGALMKEAYDEWIPDVHIEGVDTALSRYWSKDAEAVYSPEGKLLVWEPKVKQ